MRFNKGSEGHDFTFCIIRKICVVILVNNNGFEIKLNKLLHNI